MNNNNGKVELDSFEDMFNFTNQDKIRESEKIKINKLKPFPEHKFKLYTGERLRDMVQSIEEYGVLSPIIIWENNGEYIILSGHNRVEASKILGIDEIPCIIKKDLTFEEATLIVTETNLMQRSFSDLSHSERAYILEQHYNAMKKQGKRNDLLQEIENISNNNLHSLDIIGENYNLSKDKVAKYIRLAKLSDALLHKIDNNQLSFISGYNISFINNVSLQEKINTLIDKGLNISVEKSDEIKKLFNENKLNINNIDEILLNKEIKNNFNNKNKKQVRVGENILNKYFTNEDMNNKQIINIIDEALKLYFKKNKK
ncbi:MAG: ParB N-terminal domain-containing protein [Lachnospirales bacterium]